MSLIDVIYSDSDKKEISSELYGCLSDRQHAQQVGSKVLIS